MNHTPIAVQMYTVRDAAQKDLEKAFHRVADIGYAGVELAGLFDLTPAKVSQILKTLNLHCVSAHVPLTELQNNLSQTIEVYQEIGADFLVCPWLPPELRGDESDYKKLAESLNRIGENCRNNGLQFCYHHHDFELTRFNGKYGLDILLDETDPANVQLEADTYWLQFAGEAPETYIRRRPGRVPLLHLKDMTNTQPPTFAEVGTGILNWDDIFEAAKTGKTQWYIVEQDICSGDPFESLKISLTNLNRSYSVE